MTKAKLALVVVAALSNFLINSAARAQDEAVQPSESNVVIQDAVIHTRQAINPDLVSESAPSPDLGGDAMAEIMDIAAILTGDIPLPASKKALTGQAVAVAPPEGAVAAAPPGAADAPPPAEGHMGFPGMRPGMGMGMGMGGMHGCPMMGGHHGHCNPLACLEGPLALTDDQYEKLYAIKGQFIADMVPKGLNMYMQMRHMKELLTDSSLDNKAIKDVEKQISSSASDLSMACMGHVVDAAGVLTADQRHAIHMAMVKRAIGGGGHHHHHPHPDGK